MDRNDYPGDSLLGALHKSFSYTSYWLNAPPGEKATTWTGKRTVLRDRGFGFLLLWNGRWTGSEKRGAEREGCSVAGPQRCRGGGGGGGEGRISQGALIFLDQEEGGRLLPEQLPYVLGWVDAVRRAGWKGGVYCSGLPVDDGKAGPSRRRRISSGRPAHGRFRCGWRARSARLRRAA